MSLRFQMNVISVIALLTDVIQEIEDQDDVSIVDKENQKRRIFKDIEETVRQNVKENG